MSLGERKTSQEAPVHPLPPMPSILCLLSLPPPSLRLPLALQYQIGGEAQVDSSQQSYKDEVGRVGKAGQVGDHEVEVDGTDQRHDGGCDGLAQPGDRKEAQDSLGLLLSTAPSQPGGERGDTQSHLLRAVGPGVDPLPASVSWALQAPHWQDVARGESEVRL